MKLSLKHQDFKLPLIQQKESNSNKPSKTTTKRSQFSHNLSMVYHPEKQKNLPKISKFNGKPQKRHKEQNKSLQLKYVNRTNPDADDQSETDFQEKIKENKILLKKHKLKKELEKRAKSITKQMGKQNIKQTDKTNKENIHDFDKLPDINSKNYLLPKRSNKKFISFLANKNSEDWVGTIMKGTKVNRAKSNGQLPKAHLHDKLSGSDVFENIHLFLKDLQSDMPLNQKGLPKEQIYRRILRFKSQLKKIEPNSQFLKNLDQSIQMKKSLPKKKEASEENLSPHRLRYMTSTEWGKVSLNKQDFKFLASTFEDEIEKVNTYLNKTSLCLEQLLKNRMSIIDLIVLKKLKVNDYNQEIIN